MPRSARAVGLTRAWIYQVRGEDDDFRKAMDETIKESRDELEAEGWRRGKDGYDEPMVSKGKMVRTDDGNPLLVKKYSDTPLVTLLKAHHPAKYRDRASIDMTTGGKPLELSAATGDHDVPSSEPRHDIVFPSASKRWILVGSGVR